MSNNVTLTTRDFDVKTKAWVEKYFEIKRGEAIPKMEKTTLQ
jgi:hypothetical protein